VALVHDAPTRQRPGRASEDTVGGSYNPLGFLPSYFPSTSARENPEDERRKKNEEKS
jgi:hypothetical protein